MEVNIQHCRVERNPFRFDAVLREDEQPSPSAPAGQGDGEEREIEDRRSAKRGDGSKRYSVAERKRLLDELASSGETMVSGDYKPGATRFKGELVGVTVAQR